MTYDSVELSIVRKTELSVGSFLILPFHHRCQTELIEERSLLEGRSGRRVF